MGGGRGGGDRNGIKAGKRGDFQSTVMDILVGIKKFD